jgi:p-hydroxybenzoate 3-monooxygenase
VTKLYPDFQSEDEGARKAFYTKTLGREMDTQSGKNVIRFRTHVTIIGAGPAGLVLALLLQKEGIDCVIVERQSRAYVEARARAGLIEHRVVKFLRQHGLSEGMDLHGVSHTTCEFRQGGHRYKVPYGDLVGGAHVVYPQQFLVQDLLKLFISRGGTVLFSHPAVKIEGLEGNHPVVTCSVRNPLRVRSCWN